MKKFCKRLISTVLIAGMLTASFPALSFASSGGGGGGVSRDAAREYLPTAGIDSTASDRGRMHEVNTEKSGYYVLAIHTGTYIGSTLQEVFITYYDGATLDFYGIPSPYTHTAVLHPGKTSFRGTSMDQSIRTFMGYDVEGTTSTSIFNKSGSYFITMVKSAGIYGPTATSIGGHRRNIASYNTLGNIALGDSEKVKFPSVQDKISSGQPFTSNGITYLAFETEYTLDSVDNIQLFFENINGSDFSCSGIELYRVPYGKVINLENFAFISDSLDASFEGELILKSTDATNKVMKEEGLNTDQYDAINYIFYNIDKIGDVPRQDPNQRVSDDERSTIPTYHFFTEKVNDTAAAESDRRVCNFVINVDDSYGAGIESLMKLEGSTDGFDRFISDTVTATISYTDAFRNARTVNVPVISNALLEYGVNNDETIDNPRFEMLRNKSWLSIGQQGENFCFSVEFPSLSTIDSVSLSYANQYDEDDVLIIRDICVYDNWGENGAPLRENYKYCGNGDTIYMIPEGARLLYQSDNSGSVKFEPGGTTYMFHMDASPEDIYCTDEAQNYKGQNVYLIKLRTDSMKRAGTDEDVSIQLTYKTKEGLDARSLEYELRDACRDYMGYNKAQIKGIGGYDDYSYELGMQSGGEIAFLMSINNVDHFTGAIFSIGETRDEWQLADLEIIKLETLGRRTLNRSKSGDIEIVLGEKTQTMKINGIYERSYTGETLISKTNTGVYITNGESRTLDFDSGNTSGEHNTRDYSEYEYYMDYATAMSDLHFDEAAKNYEVIVKVASNASSATVSDDCGSKNLFYFQLVFKNGKRSAYVLANQQLNADGFRSGKEESFIISCNADMGDVISVNIIPDDKTSESDALDKLCIAGLEVIKRNVGTVSKSFTAENVGWIAPIFRDNAEETTVSGRPESEIATNVVITSYGYLLQLEFDIAYGDYPVNPNDSLNSKYPQFEGNMTADIAYYTTNNELEVLKGKKLVEYMYEYDGKTPIIDTETNNYMSDTSLMFRENTIDRFLLDIKDCSKLAYIKLIGDPVYNTVLPITGISVKVIQGDGVLMMNQNDEYQMRYEKAPINLTEVHDPTPTANYSFTAGAKDGRTFFFDDTHQIPKFEGESELEKSIVSRVPDSANDTLNLYVYLAEETQAPKEGGYTLTGTVTYESTASPNSFKVQTQDFKNTGEDASGHTVLYAGGLNANYLSVIRNVNLSCEHIKRPDIMVHHAVIQQVRNGVVINTFNVAFPGNIIGKSGGASSGPNTLTDLRTEETRQLVTLQLGPDTLKTKLVPEKADIAVALEYTTKAKTGTGLTSTYTSRYVFATDDERGQEINAGKILRFEFDEVGVDQIIGLKVVGAGGVPATVVGATVECYEADGNGNSSLVSCFSFEPRPTTDQKTGEKVPNPIKLTKSETKISYSDTNIIYANNTESSDYLRRFDITFTTAASSSVVDSGGTAPIRMKINYKRHNGNQATAYKTIPDIRQYVSDQYGFVSGVETTVSTFLPGLESIYSVEIEPYDNSPETKASWNLERIKYKLVGVEDESMHTIPVDRTVYEGEPLLLNLSTVYVELGYQSSSVNGKITNGEASISVKSGSKVTFVPTIYQGSSDYRAVIYQIVGDQMMEIASMTNSPASFDYQFTNNTSETAAYKVVVSSASNPASKCSVTVSVPAGSGSN